MITNFLTVAQQVAILFILIGVGFVCGKVKIINDSVSKGLSDICLYFTTPAVIIASFFRPFDSKMLFKLLIAFAVSTVFHIITLSVAYIFAHDKNIGSDSVKKFAVIFSNAGFMSLPLQMAILGEDGTFFGSSYVVVFNIIVWTYGLILMGGKGTKITTAKLIFNPGVISITVGIILFIFNLAKYIPAPIETAVNHICNLNTPIPMMIIGYHLSKSKIISAITDSRIWVSIISRLVISPLICIALLYALKFTPLAVNSTIAVSLVIAASAPCAALTTIFSEKHNCDTALSVKLVSVSTLFSIITMPLFVAIAQQIL
ncbi:MAG: AEC family transporter [Ruminococcaceae bacterium]|nr:AEC family transporter [Oscillospiraceae bacterium]